MRQFLLLTLFVCGTCFASAETPSEAKVRELEQRVNKLEEKGSLFSMKFNNGEIKLMEKDTSGLVMFAFGVVCALWAQNTGRGPWKWFFLGLLTGPIAATVMLWKNSIDKLKERISRLDT